MIKGKTQSGFEFKISETVLNDWELLEQLDELETDPVAIVRFAKLFLGQEQYNKLKAHCKKSGRVKLDLMNAELLEIFKSKPETKN